MTLTSIGYGDLVPVNDTERLACVAVMLAGGCFWAYIVASMCGLLSTLGAEKAEFSRSMTALNRMLISRNVSPDLQFRLRTFFFQDRDRQRLQKDRLLYSLLSPALVGELALAT